MAGLEGARAAIEVATKLSCLLDGGAGDPRTHAPRIGDSPDVSSELVGQAICRLLAGMRDWGPLISASSEGTETLLVLSRIRADLMSLQQGLVTEDAGDATEMVTTLAELRSRLRILTLSSELWSGAPKPRSSVLMTHEPLPTERPDFGRHRRSLDQRLSRAADELGYAP